MSTFIKNFHTQFLVDVYFSDPKRVVRLPRGEYLFRQDQFNDRLFLVKKGKLRGYGVNPDGGEVEFFIATPYMFVGVNSFFSTSKTMTNIVALEDSELAYIGYKDAVYLAGGNASLAEQFLPVVVNELTFRQTRMMDIGAEKEKALKKLIQSEKLASLGQMAAGIAHELNNAIAVLEKNTGWLGEQIAQFIEVHNPDWVQYFRTGYTEGRTISNKEIRARQRRYKTVFKLDDESAETLAQTTIAESELTKLGDRLVKDLPIISAYWEAGATLKDMLIAAHHATHVVKSVKELGVRRSERERYVDVNETINEALTLLQSDLRRINVALHFSTQPPIIANAGELIQVWSNIIKNACESMIIGRTIDPQLEITSATVNGKIVVTVKDNGPGIPENIIDKIFQPDVTTKKEGLAFGLGLGLTIVQRILDEYGAKITVKSIPGSTVFTITIPTGVHNG
jgi:signal transduction histidine kinase